jgi:hypothetical protein
VPKALAYYRNAQIMAVKSFIVLASEEHKKMSLSVDLFQSQFALAATL